MTFKFNSMSKQVDSNLSKHSTHRRKHNLNRPPTIKSSRGLAVPGDVAFVAALHNTTTDEIEAFDLDLLPA